MQRKRNDVRDSHRGYGRIVGAGAAALVMLGGPAVAQQAADATAGAAPHWHVYQSHIAWDRPAAAPAGETGRRWRVYQSHIAWLDACHGTTNWTVYPSHVARTGDCPATLPSYVEPK